MNLSPVYKLDKKDKIRKWEVKVVDDCFYVFTGIKDMEMIENITKCEPKNIGKANETNAQEQAMIEAIAQRTKKIEREGYVENIEDIYNEVFSVQLASDYSKNPERFKKKQTKKMWYQIKFDGLKGYYMDGKIYSRKGTIYTHASDKLLNDCEKIKQKLMLMFGLENPILDGELFINQNFWLEDLNSIVSGGKVLSGKDKKGRDFFNIGPDDVRLIVCNVYDEQLKGLKFEKIIPIIRECEYSHVSFFESNPLIYNEIDSILNKAISQRHEGIMIYTNRPYRAGKHDGLWKYKKMKDDEWKIIGFKETKTLTDKNKTSVKQFQHVCETETGETFAVRMEGTNQSREEIGTGQYIGKTLTIRYQGILKSGIPQFPVGVSIREDLDV